jgi:glycosyltransferase involved in cell wall biosynthesis
VAGSLEEEYKFRGCKIYHLPHGQWLGGGGFLRRAGRWRWEIKATWQFVQLIRHLKPKIVYVNTLMSVAAVFAARLLGVTVIWQIREMFSNANGEMHLPFGGWPLVRTLVRRLPTEVVCISRAVQYNVLGRKPCRKARVIYNPLASSCFVQTLTKTHARERLGIEDKAFVVGMPGNLRPVKGHMFFLATAYKILSQEDGFQFIISGSYDNPYGRKLKRYCTAMSISDRVRFVGAMKDMRTFYAACDIICVPSQGEAFGRTIIEAFAQKRPVIATRTGGITEAITDNKTGLLVEYGDVLELCNAIQKLRCDQNLRQNLIKHAWFVANELYHEKVYREQFADLLVSLGII